MSDRVYLERCSYALFFVMIVNKQQKIVLETERIDINTGHTNRNDNWNKSHKEKKKEEKKTMRILVLTQWKLLSEICFGIGIGISIWVVCFENFRLRFHWLQFNLIFFVCKRIQFVTVNGKIEFAITTISWSDFYW